VKYRKLPVVIDAVLWDGTQEAVEQLAELTGQVGFTAPDDGGIIIQTLEGNMKANVGDYIIKGVAGELYPCKPDIFTVTYQPA
jgi:hypothetical protein